MIRPAGWAVEQVVVSVTGSPLSQLPYRGVHRLCNTGTAGEPGRGRLPIQLHRRGLLGIADKGTPEKIVML